MERKFPKNSRKNSKKKFKKKPGFFWIFLDGCSYSTVYPNQYVQTFEGFSLKIIRKELTHTYWGACNRVVCTIF